MAQRPLGRKATIKDDRRLASAQWLNGLGGERQQTKGIEDWHWRDGSMALAAKSNNQKGWTIGIGAMAQRPWWQKATIKRALVLISAVSYNKKFGGGATSPDWLRCLSRHTHN
jgi:hypothetical protein